MIEPIDNISINNVFWVQMRPYLVSLGFKGLPDNIHFTISFEDRSADINFHVTKNYSDPKNKPKITIVCIDKFLLEEITPSITFALLNKLLRPLNIEELKSKYDYNLGFIPFASLEHSDTYSLTEQKLIDSFKDILKIRKNTRLKIEGDIEKSLETFATSENLQTSIFNNMVELSTYFQKPFDGGMIISEENVLQVICINDKWYTLRTDLKPVELLTAVVNTKLIKKIIAKTKRALISIKYATTYEDTEHLNKPIRLVKSQAKNTIT